MYPCDQTKLSPPKHNHISELFPFVVKLGPSWRSWGKYLQNVEPKSIFHSTKISHRSGEVRLLDPGRPKSPQRYLICIPIVLTWLRCNSLRASEGELLQAKTTWLIYSGEPHTATLTIHLICCCGAGAACAKKANKQKKKPNITFSPLCSNTTLQWPTLIIL